jgi:hypothetical protein
VKPSPKLPVFFLFFCLLPFTALADAGTPLMWAGIIHLVIGNALIGLLEGAILASIFKLNYLKCVLVMVAANYFSSWGGGVFLDNLITGHLSLDLYNAWFWFWTMVAVTFLLTLILEWPFVFFCFRKSPHRFKRSFWGNLLINSASYLLLFGWYWGASGTGIYRNMHVVQPSQMTMPTNAIVFYISSTNGDVYALNLQTRNQEKIYALKSTNTDDRLLVRPSKREMNSWDIYASSKLVLIQSNLNVTAKQAQRDQNDDANSMPQSPNGTWFNFGETPKLGAAENSGWTFETGFWPIEGLRGKNPKTGESIYFSLETPFVAWNVRNGTHLPGDYVIFQLGENQICILEATTKKIAMLDKGYGPIVILKNQ